jgi:hypothetical protein
MRVPVILLTALAALVAAPALAQQAQTDPQQRIVVTGIRTQDYRDRLAQCLARHCPTNEDADATLALAEALFLNGEYRDARGIVQASLRRNAGNARNFPEPVSDLYRAHARLSWHLGFDSDGRRSTYGILNALQAGIPTEDYRHFTARLEISEALMAAGNFNSADRDLAELGRLARAAGREDVATIADLRRLWFDYMATPDSPTPVLRLTQFANDPDPAQRMRAVGAQMILARVYRAKGQDARADALIAAVGRASAGGSHRRLLVSPRYQLQVREFLPPEDANSQDPSTYVDTINQISDNFEDKWIDVGFWILPNGHVSGLEIVRHGGNETAWSDPVITAIEGRAYSEGPEPTYRLERYTYTSRYIRMSGSNLPRRSRAARIEYMDLTINEPPAIPRPAAPQGRTPTPA